MPPPRSRSTTSASARSGRRRPKRAGRGSGSGLVEYARANAARPFFAIGGIDPGNIAEVVAAGATRIGAVRAIRDAERPQAAAEAMRPVPPGG